MARRILTKGLRFASDLVTSLVIGFFAYGFTTVVGLLIIGNPFQMEIQDIVFIAFLLGSAASLAVFVCLTTGRFLPIRRYIEQLRILP